MTDTEDCLNSRLHRLIEAANRNPEYAVDIRWAIDQIERHDALFDLRWAADMRAIKRWQKANYGNDLVWPDHADLVVWLMEQLDGMRKVLDGHDGA